MPPSCCGCLGRSPLRGGPEAGGSRAVGFTEAALFQWVNPKSWLVCASATATYLQAGAGSALGQSLAFGGLFLAASLPSCFVWLAFGAALQPMLRSPQHMRIFNVSMGVLLAASVVLIVF